MSFRIFSSRTLFLLSVMRMLCELTVSACAHMAQERKNRDVIFKIRDTQIFLFFMFVIDLKNDIRLKLHFFYIGHNLPVILIISSS